MRRALLIVVLCLAFPATASAKVVACSGGKCKGTDQADQITGSVKVEQIYGLGGDDTITAKWPLDGPCGGPLLGLPECSGGDKVYGGGGNDTIDTDEFTQMIQLVGNPLFPEFAQAGDYVNCGSGSKDVAKVDLHDTVASNCEKIERSP